MGLFSRKKIIAVTSVVYNLAGDENDRQNFLKTTILSAAMGQRDLPQSFTGAYLGGPGIRLSNFADWADTKGYNATIGNNTGNIRGKLTVDQEVVAQYIPVPAGSSIRIVNTEIDAADFSYWAGRFVSEYDPSLLSTDYLADMNESTGEITISFVGGGTQTFIPADYDRYAQYMYVTYAIEEGQTLGPLDTGVTVILGISDDFPETIDWDVLSSSDTPHSITLNTRTETNSTFSDARPPETTDTTVGTLFSYEEVHEVFEKRIGLPSVPGTSDFRDEIQTMYQDTTADVTQAVTTTTTTETIAGGVVKTTVTTVTTDTATVNRSYRIDTQEVTYKGISPTKCFIYKQGGSIPALNAMFTANNANVGKFFPIIPVRLDNAAVQYSAWPHLYEPAKKAYKKAIGKKYDDLIENVADNPSLGDIDYAYMVFGVSLNTKENVGKAYIYNFFKLLGQDPTLGSDDYDAFKASWEAAHQSQLEWIEWAERNIEREDSSPWWVDPEPVKIPYPVMPKETLNLSQWIHYNVAISWNFIKETVNSGKANPTAKPGDYFISQGTSDEFEPVYWNEREESDSGGFISKIFAKVFGEKESNHTIYIDYQETDNKWTRLTIRGLTHNNVVYSGRGVFTNTKQALEDPEESGFIIPLHENIFNSTKLIDRTQLGMSCCYLVFNCYVSRKQKWYETSIFKVIVIIILVVITVMSLGTSSPVTGPMATAVAALGTIGIPTIVATFIVKAIVAIIITKILTKLAIKAFGEEVGAIVAVIASMYVMQLSYNGFSMQGMAVSFSNMLAAPNLLMLTSSSLDAYSKYMQASTNEIQAQSEAFQTEYDTLMKELNDKIESQFGSKSTFDVTQITDILYMANESPDAFLQRTLMVGSDIANMSIEMLHNFVEMTVNTDLPT
jgi:hypothetical protein